MLENGKVLARKVLEQREFRMPLADKKIKAVFGCYNSRKSGSLALLLLKQYTADVICRPHIDTVTQCGVKALKIIPYTH